MRARWCRQRHNHVRLGHSKPARLLPEVNIRKEAAASSAGEFPVFWSMEERNNSKEFDEPPMPIIADEAFPRKLTTSLTKSCLPERAPDYSENENTATLVERDSGQSLFLQRPLTGGSCNTTHKWRNLLPEGVCPAYTDGALVEYHSKKYGCWLNGRVSLQVLCTEESQLQKAIHICYDVKLAGVAKHHQNVTLDMLRPPLEVAERVEVFMTRWGMWASGAITSEQLGMPQSSISNLSHDMLHSKGSSQPHTSSEACGIRYHVWLDDSGDAPETTMEPGQLLEDVPAIRLRRAFPPSAHVEVYCGLASGWVPAVVAQKSCEEKIPEPLSSYSPVASSQEVAQSLALSRTLLSPKLFCLPCSPSSTKSSPSLKSSAHLPQSAVGILHPWTMQAVVEQGGAGRDIEEVPSYLIRRRSLLMAGSLGCTAMDAHHDHI